MKFIETLIFIFFKIYCVLVELVYTPILLDQKILFVTELKFSKTNMIRRSFSFMLCQKKTIQEKKSLRKNGPSNYDFQCCA